jgi:spermidine/putrescine transport system permease protein
MNVIQRGYLVLVYGFLYLPMVFLIVNSFNASKYGIRWEGLTLSWYHNLVNDSDLVQAGLNSLVIATLSATLSGVLGSLGAMGLYRYSFRGKVLLQGLLFVTLMSPDIIMAVSLLILFILLNVQLGFWSLLLAHTTFCLPFVVVTVLSRLKGFNLSILEAAKDLGASEWSTIRYVVLPLVAPAIGAGWLLSFTLSLDDVVVSFFVTGPTFEVLPLRIYSMVRLGVKPEVNALATLLFGLSLLMVSLSQLLLRKNER